MATQQEIDETCHCKVCLQQKQNENSTKKETPERKGFFFIMEDMADAIAKKAERSEKTRSLLKDQILTTP